MEDSDICFAPVLTPTEAAQHMHIKARNIYTEYEGALEAKPAPRFRSQKAPIARKNACGLKIDQVMSAQADCFQCQYEYGRRKLA